MRYVISSGDWNNYADHECNLRGHLWELCEEKINTSEAAAFKMKVCSERLKGGEREGGEWQYRIMTIMQKLKDLFHVDITLIMWPSVTCSTSSHSE